MFSKDPSAVLDYGFDWSLWLGTDTVSASTWTVSPSSMTIASNSFSSTQTTVWLTGGTAGLTYTLVNHVTTTAGRQDDRTMTIVVENR